MGSSSPNKKLVFDVIRNIWITATPEEIVRQKLLQKMTHELGYSQGLLAIERDIRIFSQFSTEEKPPPERRSDIICFAKNIHPTYSLYPLLLIECKSKKFNKKAFEQVLGYNRYIKAYFVAVADPEVVQIGYYSSKEKEYVFFPFLPSFDQLLRVIHGSSK